MLKGEEKVWYAAFKAKDTRFDGRFFIGVSSTGIYCRPVCRARLPKAENCTFYVSASAAEQAGYRPCLLCRPELAPGNAPVDAVSSLARRAAGLLEADYGSEQGIEKLADRLGCSSRHLRRAFAAEYSVSPVQYLQTCRLLLAKSLLTDTNLPVISVAMAAGFGSLRRFNALFKKQYGLAPTAMRKQVTGNSSHDTHVTLTLGYRPPYQWKQILDFLAGRVIAGVEKVVDDEYFRTVRLDAGDGQPVYGWIKVGHRPQKNALAVTVSATLLPVLSQVLDRVRHLFDLCCDPDAIVETLAVMNSIRPGLCVPGIRLPGCFDTFEMTVRAVLGQQITVKAAGTLATRLAQVYGTAVDTGIKGLTHVFPSPETLLSLQGQIADHLGLLGITRARANTILGLAKTLAEGEIDLRFCAEPQAELEKLMMIPGIGAWTAQYIAMRAIGWPDAFPHTDYGVKKALSSHVSAEILVLAESWRPWRSYATINLWNTL
ncbi:helix-turn-helix domain-containing protein [Oxalobacter vibrioformis]|uniref:DNA-3-methyladenine glycosylase II n=1 Tax=Oxalobacter vibrioformis TaxID=933080 RepID=A0A9E9M0A1_9BURK|nr:AlkA N-terminal domain-containing protein [Oxalobacter vibrioformis]WAW10824.1 helix-turn-helix domain-containing protein [Oxalobacter vibrioformis]